MDELLNKPLSPSRASSYRDCPLQFRYKYIDAMPERPSLAAFRGTLVHQVLENMFARPIVERSRESVINDLPIALASLLNDRPENAAAIDPEVTWPADSYAARSDMVEAFLAGAEVLVHTYFELEDPTRLNPTGLELHVSTTLESGTKIHGIIDRFEETADGAIRISDYKTGKSPRPQYAAKYWFQMLFYALITQRERGVLPQQLQLLFLKDGARLTKQPVQQDIDELIVQIEDIAAGINANIVAQHFEPTPNKLCDWCDFQDKCPAKGGTMLPFPSRT